MPLSISGVGTMKLSKMTPSKKALGIMPLSISGVGTMKLSKMTPS
jgi:hypothetical protein